MVDRPAAHPQLIGNGPFPEARVQHVYRCRRTPQFPKPPLTGPPEAAVDDEEVQVRMTVRTGAKRLQTRHDQNREITHTSQRTNDGGDRGSTRATA
jgi:hypothetical protein